MNVSKSVTINTQDATINSDNSATIKTNYAKIDSGKIEFGKNADQSLVLGELFMTLYNSHNHPSIDSLGVTLPTMPPTMPMDTSHLSQISKTQ